MSHTVPDTTRDAILADWIARLTDLVDNLEAWAKSLDWSTRRIDKPMKDSITGPYQAPGLLLQKDFTRILIDPISRSTPSLEGRVDIYLMPALDDIAILYFDLGRWNIYDQLSDNEPIPSVRDSLPRPLTKETFAEILDKLTQHAA